MKKRKVVRRDTRLDRRPKRRSARVRAGERQRRKLTRDPDARERWDGYKRRPPRGTKKGKSERNDASRAEIGSRTMECPRCGLLVDWRAAKGAATKARRGLRAGDGCRGPQCGKRQKARAPVRARAQAKMANGLLKGTKVLVAWPGGSDDWHVWERPVETAWAIARAILSKLGASMMG